MSSYTDSTNLSSERFGFTLFLSICVHVVFILGVGFTVMDQIDTSSSMEITLATYQSSEAPETPDFLAQENQLGSGSQEDAAAPRSPVVSKFNANDIADVESYSEPSTANPSYTESILVTTRDAEEEISTEESEMPEEESANQPVENMSENQLADRLASLQAQLDLRREAYAKRPRRYTISSASTQKSRDAMYLDNWRKKVEAVGNLNYPAEASRNRIYGNLRLLVAINPDGTINDVRVLSSSGFDVLDNAAIEIVNLAAPYAPFPDDMRQEVDILEIIRTWQFQQNNSLRSF